MTALLNLVGTVFGKYEVRSLVGHGGMADVYLAYRQDLDLRVAVKVIHPRLAQDDDFVERFRQEARTVAHLDHPGIVQVHDYFEMYDYYCLVMEFIEGETLADRLHVLEERNQRMSLLEIVRIISALCQALDYAHSRKMVHRDIKPSNVMFKPRPDGEMPVLADFGLAKIVKMTSLTDTKSLTGTPLYMPPEQFRYEPVDGRSDIYSLGAMLYELTTGHVPFDGDNIWTIGFKHCQEPVPLPGLYNPDLPESFEAIILKAMEKKPEGRYQRMTEMAYALESALVEHMAINPPSLVGPGGRVFLLGQPPILIGRPGKSRLPDVDLTEIDSDVASSRQHAEVLLESGSYVLRPEQTTNGTFVNGNEVFPGMHYTLKDDDVIQFGLKGVELTFRLPHAG